MQMEKEYRPVFMRDRDFILSGNGDVVQIRLDIEEQIYEKIQQSGFKCFRRLFPGLERLIGHPNYLFYGNGTKNRAAYTERDKKRRMRIQKLVCEQRNRSPEGSFTDPLYNVSFALEVYTILPCFMEKDRTYTKTTIDKVRHSISRNEMEERERENNSLQNKELF